MYEELKVVKEEQDKLKKASDKKDLQSAESKVNDDSSDDERASKLKNAFKFASNKNEKKESAKIEEINDDVKIEEEEEKIPKQE